MYVQPWLGPGAEHSSSSPRAWGGLARTGPAAAWLGALKVRSPQKVPKEHLRISLYHQGGDATQ